MTLNLISQKFKKFDFSFWRIKQKIVLIFATYKKIDYSLYMIKKCVLLLAVFVINYNKYIIIIYFLFRENKNILILTN